MKSCLRLLVCNDIFPLLLQGGHQSWLWKLQTYHPRIDLNFVCVCFFVQYSDAAFGDSDIVALIWHFGGLVFFGRFPLWGGVSQSNRLVRHFGYWRCHCHQADAVPPSGTVLGFRVWKRSILDQNKFLKNNINIFAVGQLNSFLPSKLQKLACRGLCVETNIKYLTVPACSVEVYS
jgi:hypothetical protein